MTIMVCLFIYFYIRFCFCVIGKWDQVTGINSPLYKSHTELENHEAWKNAVRIIFIFF